MSNKFSQQAFFDVLQAIETAGKLEHISEQILRLPSLYNVQQVAYCAPHIFDDCPRNTAIVLHTFNPEWAALYAERNYAEIDPVLAELQRSALPIDWDHIDRRSEQTRAFFAEAKRHGIGERGCTIPLENRYGERAFLTFTADLPDGEWQRFRRAREAELAYLGWHLHERVMTLCGRRKDPAHPPLTPQERRCLEHLIQARSPKAIAREMNLSVSTVRMHLNNARRKLGCKTIPQAVAVAVRLSLVAIAI